MLYLRKITFNFWKFSLLFWKVWHHFSANMYITVVENWQFSRKNCLKMTFCPKNNSQFFKSWDPRKAQNLSQKCFVSKILTNEKIIWCQFILWRINKGKPYSHVKFNKTHEFLFKEIWQLLIVYNLLPAMHKTFLEWIF